MAIEIELTPRKLERILFITIILFFMSTTIYYSYRYSQATKTENNISGAVVIENTETIEEEVKEEPKATVEEVPAEPKVSEFSGNVEITIAPIRYNIKESATFRKAVIDTLSFIIGNEAESDLQMKVKVYHSNAETSDDYNKNPRTTLEFPIIKHGDHQTKTFFNVEGLNLYHTELDQTLKFVFEDMDGGEIQTLNKVVKVS